MRTWTIVVLGTFLLLVSAGAAERVTIEVDASEAEAVLGILAKRAADQPVQAADWNALFETKPYQRLKAREAAMKRAFTDEEFRSFVLTPELASRESRLRDTLAAWRRADLASIGARVLRYLPADATIRASVYPVIKPRDNSFVFETRTNPAIFLYLDPDVSAAAFENTVAHELHHIGLASASADYDARIAALPAPARTAAEWLGAFGEGLAMLAAAGSADVHPHQFSKPDDRARWDRDVATFDAQVRDVERFLLDIVAGRLEGDEAILARGFTFFGETQGAWYTVGYRMASAIERHRGRDAVVRCAEDPRRLLRLWNDLVREGRETGAVWSRELLDALSPEP